MKKFQTEVSYFQPKLKAEVDNDKLRLVNSSYHDHVKTEFNNCFLRKSFVLFDIFAPSEVNVVVIGGMMS